MIPRIWTTTPDTEILEGVEYRNVWKKTDADAMHDAEALGSRMPKPSYELPAGFWSKDLAVVAYENQTLVAIVPCEVQFAPRLQCNMAVMRVFVAPEYRKQGVVIPLTMKFHEVIRRYAEDNPDLRIAGTMGQVTVKGVWDEAIGKAAMILIGYTPQGDPLVVRWFEGFKL